MTFVYSFFGFPHVGTFQLGNARGTHTITPEWKGTLSIRGGWMGIEWITFEPVLQIHMEYFE